MKCLKYMTLIVTLITSTVGAALAGTTDIKPLYPDQYLKPNSCINFAATNKTLPDSVITNCNGTLPYPNYQKPTDSKDRVCPMRRLTVANYSNTIALSDADAQRWRFSFMFHSDGDTSQYGVEAYSLQNITNRLNSIFGENSWSIFNIYNIPYSKSSKLPASFENTNYIVQVDVDRNYTGVTLRDLVQQVFLQDSTNPASRAQSKLPYPTVVSGEPYHQHWCRINAMDVAPLLSEDSTKNVLDLKKQSTISGLYKMPQLWHETYTSTSDLNYFSQDVIEQVKRLQTEKLPINYDVKKPNYAARESIIGGHLFRAIFDQLVTAQPTNVLIYDARRAVLDRRTGYKTADSQVLIERANASNALLAFDDTIIVQPTKSEALESGVNHIPFYKGQVLKTYEVWLQDLENDKILKGYKKTIELPHMTKVAWQFTGDLLGTKSPLIGVNDAGVKKFINMSYFDRYNKTFLNPRKGNNYTMADVLYAISNKRFTILEEQKGSKCSYLPCFSTSYALKPGPEIAAVPKIINFSQGEIDYDYDEEIKGTHPNKQLSCGGAALQSIWSRFNKKGLADTPLLVVSEGNEKEGVEGSNVNKIAALAYNCEYVISVDGLDTTSVSSSSYKNNVKLHEESRFGHMYLDSQSNSNYVGAPFVNVGIIEIQSTNGSGQHVVDFSFGTSLAAPQVSLLATMVNAAWPAFSTYKGSTTPAEALYKILRDSFVDDMPVTIGFAPDQTRVVRSHAILNYECVANFLIQAVYNHPLDKNATNGLIEVAETLKRVQRTGSPLCRYQTLNSIKP